MAERTGVLLTASFGRGHLTAAQAVKDWCGRLDPGLELTMIDYFERFVSPRVTRMAQVIYLQTVRHAACLYGLFYGMTSCVGAHSRSQRRFNRLGKAAFARYYQAERPDVIVCLYPTPAGAVSELKGEGIVDAPAATIITDYALHSQWIHPHTDVTLVGAPFLREALIARGLQPERVAVTGIPISPRFAERRDRCALRHEWGFARDRPLVLVMSGAFGMMGGLLEVFHVLRELPEAQAVFVVGHDRGSKRRLDHAAARYADRMRVLGFTERVPDLMAMADLCVTKSGGATVTEAMVSGLPMIIHRPIPGQEHWNMRYLVENDAATATRGPRDLRRVLTHWVRSREAVESKRENVRRLSPPDPARLAAEHIVRLIGERR